MLADGQLGDAVTDIPSLRNYLSATRRGRIPATATTSTEPDILTRNVKCHHSGHKVTRNRPPGLVGLSPRRLKRDRIEFLE